MFVILNEIYPRAAVPTIVSMIVIKIIIIIKINCDISDNKWDAKRKESTSLSPSATIVTKNLRTQTSCYNIKRTVISHADSVPGSSQLLLHFALI